MSDIPRTLPEDIVCLMGTVERSSHGPTLHRTWAYTMEQVTNDCWLCGMRGDWIIWLASEPPPEPFYSEQLKPLLLASISRAKRPVVYHAPKTRLL